MSVRVLLAMDKAKSRDVLAGILEAAEYEVAIAKDGPETAARLLSQPYDALVLDLDFPEPAVWQAFDALSQARPLLPVVGVTDQADGFERAMALKLDAVMRTPLKLLRLLCAIQELSAQTRAERLARLGDPNFEPWRLSFESASPALGAGPLQARTGLPVYFP